jgi:uncharacterized membrane protein YdfJ with MMPL/SSD domain
VTIAVWLGLGLAGFLGRAHIGEVTAAGQSSFLPANSEATRALDIGSTVAVGVLLDTFLVRALLIPAITHRLGDRAWWPSAPRRP